MTNHGDFMEELIELEQLLVRQFRGLQELVQLTRAERELLLKGGTDIMRVVEDKEALLDQLSLMEDNRRKLAQDMALAYGLHSDQTSIGELCAVIDFDVAIRIRRLSEGISALASQARDLNHSNQALTFTRLDWLKAVQSFLIGVAQPETGYQPPGSPTAGLNETAGLGLELRA